MRIDMNLAIELAERSGKEWSVSNYSRQRGAEGCTAMIGDTSFDTEPEAIATAETPAQALLDALAKVGVSA